MLRFTRLFVATITLVVLTSLLLTIKPVEAGVIQGDQVRVYLTDGSNIQITYFAVSGFSSSNEYRIYPFAREAKTTGRYWKYYVNTWIILSNGVQTSCFVSLRNYPLTTTESFGISSQGLLTQGGGPGSGCTRQR